MVTLTMTYEARLGYMLGARSVESPRDVDEAGGDMSPESEGGGLPRDMAGIGLTELAFEIRSRIVPGP